MKLKNIKVGDLIEAKCDFPIKGIEKGEQLVVARKETDDYIGYLSLILRQQGAPKCLTSWFDHRDFRKPRKEKSEMQIAVGDKFKVVKGKLHVLGTDGIGTVLEVVEHKTPCENTSYAHWLRETSGTNTVPWGAWVNEDGVFGMHDIGVILEPFEEVELTGSDLCRAMLDRGDKLVFCYVSDISEDEALTKQVIGVVVAFNSQDERFRTTGFPWTYAVPVSARTGEPLTQQEAGL